MGLFEKIDKQVLPNSNLFLLISICFFIFIIPFFPVSSHQYFRGIFFSLIFFTSIFTLNSGRKFIFTGAVIAFITEWIAEWINMPLLTYASLVTNILFFQIIVIKLIIQIARSKKASASVIFESINAYLLMGIMFAVWVTLAMLYDPNSFSFPFENPTTMDYLYYTFVTMTTLGYGEITPTLPYAKSLSILIATSGQIYVAVIIAMLVGKYAGAQNSN